MRQDHPLCDALRAAWAREGDALCAGKPRPELRAWHLPGFGLVVRVEALDLVWFNLNWLRGEPGHGIGMLTRDGERLWDALHQLAAATAAVHGGADSSAALFLDPEVIDALTVDVARMGAGVAA